MAEKWTQILVALGGASGLITFIGFFVAPASKRIALQRTSADRVMFLSNGITRLSLWGDALRERVLRHEPDAVILTASENLSALRRDLETMRPDYEADDVKNTN